MKTNYFFGILVLFLCTITFVSCNNDDSNRWYDSMPDGGFFYTGTGLRFFYVDEEGNDLINPEDYSTLPVSSLEQLDSQPAIDFMYKNYAYNNEYNNVLYSSDLKLYEFFTYAFGDSRLSDYTFYVYHNGVADKMDVTFQYQNHKVNAGLYYASTVTSWKVNDVEVYNIKKPAMRTYVRLIKKSDGTTDIVVEE